MYGCFSPNSIILLELDPLGKLRNGGWRYQKVKVKTHHSRIEVLKGPKYLIIGYSGFPHQEFYVVGEVTL